MMPIIKNNANNISKINQIMTKPAQNSIKIIFSRIKYMWHALVLSLTALSAGCTSLPTSNTASNQPNKTAPSPQTPKPETTEQKALENKNLYRLVKFSDIPNWDKQDFSSTYLNFKAQCPQLLKRSATAYELKRLCETIVKNSNKTESYTAKQWFESKFDAWQLVQENGDVAGLLTGYFEPVLKGSKTKSQEFSHPLYPTPPDLISVELSNLYSELKGMRLRGQLQGNKLVPYPTREEWESVGPQRVSPLVYVQDPLDAFLMQVQGSGRIELENGKTIRLGYAEQNGHPYVSIGQVLVKRGTLTAEQATIPGIKGWAVQNPKELKNLLNQNPSVVFFKETQVNNPNEGPMGSLGVALNPEASVAIDATVVTLGLPVFLASEHPTKKTPYERLVLAQDTGGAIRGRVRADLFWGWGETAGKLAGVTRQPLKMWVLTPKGAVPPLGQ